MQVNSIQGSNSLGRSGVITQQGTDSYTKALQNQIANAQEQLQALSANKELSAEEKMEKRQELQKKISEWNIQLRQHQIELRREQQEESSRSMKEYLGEDYDEQKEAEQGVTVGISRAGMEALIAADTSMKQVKVQGNVAKSFEGRTRVLQGEIEMSAATGGSVKAKEEEKAELEKKISQIQEAQADKLSDIIEELQKTAESDKQDGSRTGEQTDKTDEKQNANILTENLDTKETEKLKTEEEQTDEYLQNEEDLQNKKME